MPDALQAVFSAIHVVVDAPRNEEKKQRHDEELSCFAALAWAWLGYIATVGMAQDPILAQFYGSGVHEYFSGGYRQAIADLTEAVDGGTKDPRVFYFRALSCAVWATCRRPKPI